MKLSRPAFYAATAEGELAELRAAAEARQNKKLVEEAIAAVRSAWSEDWRSAAWWLERTQPYQRHKERTPASCANERDHGGVA